MFRKIEKEDALLGVGAEGICEATALGWREESGRWKEFSGTPWGSGFGDGGPASAGDGGWLRWGPTGGEAKWFRERGDRRDALSLACLDCCLMSVVIIN